MPLEASEKSVLPLKWSLICTRMCGPCFLTETEARAPTIKSPHCNLMPCRWTIVPASEGGEEEEEEEGEEEEDAEILEIRFISLFLAAATRAFT